MRTALVAHLYSLHASQIIPSIPRASSLPVRPSTGSPGRHPGALGNSPFSHTRIYTGVITARDIPTRTELGDNEKDEGSVVVIPDCHLRSEEVNEKERENYFFFR
ncbi:hypothetical protein TNCT_446311 [Trichonephila clavata]|uniref:Uncharacterized protein n=1 Tax=Trichonephila clavata TaxID=2740835 RepID=A0A8X6LC85_TRICU|nr:hypothetical protein TNCT_446311 [Trichonephila clavata]